MKVEVSLFGFGEDRPAKFSSSDRLDLNMNGPSTIATALASAGLANAHGISVMLNGVLAPPRDWDQKNLADGDSLKVLLALEGG